MTTLVKPIPSFSDAALTPEQVRTILRLGAAVLFGALLHPTYGLDLSFGFF